MPASRPATIVASPPASAATPRSAVRLVAILLVALIGAAALTTVSASPAAAATCPPATEPPFTDVPLGHPFCREIANAAGDGWVAGYPDGSFLPASNITRQAAAAMLWRAANIDGPAAPQACTAALPSGFTDVPNDHPFCGHIRDTALAGVFEGYPDGTFRAGQNITRQAVAAALVRFQTAEVPAFVLVPCEVGPFSDVPVDHAFCEEITYLADGGITNGYPDGSYHPGSPITRQGFVVQLYRTLTIVT